MEVNKLIDRFNNNYLLNKGFSTNEMNYNTDWNNLMKVVEKIESLGYLCQLRPRIFKVLYKGNNTSIQGEGDNRLDATYDGIIEFIKWYNENKQD